MHVNCLTIPATLDSLATIAAFVLAAADAAGLGRQARYRLRLAVDELATNIIIHGYPAVLGVRSLKPTIDIRLETDENALTVILEDAGVPFDPRQVAPPDDLHLPPEERKIGGLGVYLALGGVDRFSYEWVGDRNRSMITMNLPAASG